MDFFDHNPGIRRKIMSIFKCKPNVNGNIFDHKKSPLPRLRGMERNGASSWGVPVLETGIYQMISGSALYENAIQYFLVADFISEQNIELKLPGMSGKDQ